MKRCYIVGAGELYGFPNILDGDFVIAADAGAEPLLKNGIIPDVLIGDFDSLLDENQHAKGVRAEELLEGNEGEGFFAALSESSDKKSEIIRYPVMKDETDMLLAYRLGVERGYDTFYIYGGVGGREDHTFANYCLLLEAKKQNKSAYLVGNRCEAFVIKDEKIHLCSKQGFGISVFAFGSDAKGVNIRGLKYEAENVDLAAHSSLGVSNSFTEREECEISVEDGALLIIRET